jgi:regulation of enolase protein 1 (concanavalin A-like superfamily)
MSRLTEGLPYGLQWEIEPASSHVDGADITVEATGQSDYFIDPAGTATALNGARAVGPVPDSEWQLSARVVADLTATYDAGVLLLWSDERHFAKLCLERSPQGQAMIVSVVTREVSDDANAWDVEGDAAWLRISGLTNDTYAFHSSKDGAHWELVRHFRLIGSRPMKYGISAQSPIGDGCSVTFEELSVARHSLKDLRDFT